MLFSPNRTTKAITRDLGDGFPTQKDWFDYRKSQESGFPMASESQGMHFSHKSPCGHPVCPHQICCSHHCWSCAKDRVAPFWEYAFPVTVQECAACPCLQKLRTGKRSPFLHITSLWIKFWCERAMCKEHTVVGAIKFTEPRNCWGWEGPLDVIWANLPCSGRAT